MDEFSEYYQDLIEDRENCVDQIVLNAWFAMWDNNLEACAYGGGP